MAEVEAIKGDEVPLEELEAAGMPDHIRMTKERYEQHCRETGVALPFATLWLRGETIYIVDRKKIDQALSQKTTVDMAVASQAKEGQLKLSSIMKPSDDGAISWLKRGTK